MEDSKSKKFVLLTVVIILYWQARFGGSVPKTEYTKLDVAQVISGANTFARGGITSVLRLNLSLKDDFSSVAT